MNRHYEAFVALGKSLVGKSSLDWEIPLDAAGWACDGVGWNLTKMTGDVPPPMVYLRDLGLDAKSLSVINARRIAASLQPLEPRPLSNAWQDFIKAAVAEQLLFRRNTTIHATQSVGRPLRVIATCTESEPWALTLDDVQYAVRIAGEAQGGGKLADLVAGLIRLLFDAKHICDASPLYHALDAQRMKGRSTTARHRMSKEELRGSLEARKRGERLPERRAFWELTRIVMTEKPKTFADDLRFAAMRALIITGMRAGEVALLPTDWKRERTYLDANGRPAGESGGISTSLMVRHFAEKQQDEQSDSRVLREAVQPVPEMFRAILTETLDHVARISSPLRETLKLQCETGRLLPWYPASSIVPIHELYTRLTGNPFWQPIDKAPFIDRYRQSFDPAVLLELHAYQLERRQSAKLKLENSIYVFGNRLKNMMLDGKTTLRFRHGDGTAINLLERLEWNAIHFCVGELEEHVRQLTPTKVSDTSPFPLANGFVQPWELLFIQPKRSLAEERNDGICDVVRYMAVNCPDRTFIGHTLGDAPEIPSIFEKYGATEEDRALKIESHKLRHLQNTELFRMGVADTIISKRFNRRSVAQSYEYDHRSLAESLDDVDLPEDIEIMLGEKASSVARLIKSGKASGPIVETFRRIEENQGDAAGYEYLRAEADGFHGTPYGYCLNSFTVDPCPKHLECFAGCRHLSATDLPEHRENLIRLEGKLALALESVRSRSSTSIGWKNQLTHAEERLVGVQKLLATPAGSNAFPDGRDLSVSPQRGLLDD
jgi:hypothetical protein